MAARASIVGAAVTHVGKVREHNEDAHMFDSDLGFFIVCDGMGGHAAGEVASAIAIKTVRSEWSSGQTLQVADKWIAKGTPDARRQLLSVIRRGVVAAHDAIIAEAQRDEAKTGMGTTLVGAMVVGGDVVFAHAGDSRAYLVRDGIAMQLTEDHTLLARLLAAGIEVDSIGEGSRFKSMLTNALGIGQDCRVSTFVVPLADGDRFLLCSDGISEYVKEAEIGEALTKQPSPARAAQKLVDWALERGGGDNATALVVRVLEAGETPHPAEQRKKDDAAIAMCPLWGEKVTPQGRLRALRIALPRDHATEEKIPAQTLGDRVAWIVVEGEVSQSGRKLGPGALLYPEALVADAQLPDKDSLAVATTEVRALAIRADDFRELCDDDAELGEALLESLANLMATRRAQHNIARHTDQENLDALAVTDPHGHAAVVAPPVVGRSPTLPTLPPPMRGVEPDLAHASTAQMAVPRAAAAAAVEAAAVPPPIPAETSEPVVISQGKPTEDDVVKRQPLTSETSNAVSGSIDVGPKRKKRMTDGWDPD